MDFKSIGFKGAKGKMIKLLFHVVNKTIKTSYRLILFLNHRFYCNKLFNCANLQQLKMHLVITDTLYSCSSTNSLILFFFKNCFRQFYSMLPVGCGRDGRAARSMP